MFHLEVFRNETAVTAILIGAALVILVIVGYLDMWLPRGYAEDDKRTSTNWLSWWRAIPWFLKIIFAGSAVFAILYTIYVLNNPVGW